MRISHGAIDTTKNPYLVEECLEKQSCLVFRLLTMRKHLKVCVFMTFILFLFWSDSLSSPNKISLASGSKMLESQMQLQILNRHLFWTGDSSNKRIFLLGHLQDNRAGLFHFFGGLLARSRLDYAAPLLPAALEVGQQQPVCRQERPGWPGKALASRLKETLVSRGLRAGDQAGHSLSARLGTGSTAAAGLGSALLLVRLRWGCSGLGPGWVLCAL